MARKPNYDFERKERERLKALKTAARKEAKAKESEDKQPTPPAAETDSREQS
jgi:hypothetical protein